MTSSLRVRRTRVRPEPLASALLSALAALAAPVAGPGLASPRVAQVATAPGVVTTELTQGWALRSATGVADGGAVISQPGYAGAGWYPVTLPSTVMAGLVANNVYANIYNDTNLQGVPDLTTQNWWYRGEFTAPAAGTGQRYWLRFKGIAYQAQVWLNGTEIDADAIGTMATHEYDVTSLVHQGAVNALALLVTPPLSSGNDLSFWYVDWNPKPPDMNAGIWGKLFLDAVGPVALRDPYVQTVLPLPDTTSADLTVYADAVNGTAAPVSGVLQAVISKPGYPTITVSQNVTLAANERREIAFDPATYPALHVVHPALWWPIHMGNPELYDLALTFTAGTDPSANASVRFGIRQCTDYVTPAVYGSTYRGYKVNGQPVLIRGADYVWDMLLRTPLAVTQAHMNYVKDMGLNLVRFEGILGNENLYDCADEDGILLMPGFVCCTYWASYGSWTAQDHAVADASLESQMRHARAHASALVWAYGSDELPVASVLTGWKAIATRLHWQNPTLDNLASYNNTGGSVPKMNGPYVWEPPVYWYANTTDGGAFGFCAEQGGESVPPEETLRRFISPAGLWPIGATYGYHAGASPFDNLNFYTPAVNNRYGTATNVTDYADRAQLLDYESERAQFEAYGANAYTLAYGTIYWMLDNAWPSVHWNLYDYYFKPGGGYFGTKKALEPVHILYDYAAKGVKVFNATLAPASGATATVRVYNLPDLALKDSTRVTMSFPANASTPVLTLPTLGGLSTTYLLRLQLADATGASLSDNLYWISTTADALGKKSDWYHTAVSTYANMTGLNTLPTNTSVGAYWSRNSDGTTDTVILTLTNTSPTALAFFLRAEVTAGVGGLEVVPVTYTDNDVTLFPGESTTITARYATADLGGQQPSLRVRGYNVPSFTGAVVGVSDGPVAGALSLLSGAPNPFRGRTAIRFALPRRESASLRVYDAAGRLVRTLLARAVTAAGEHELAWDGRSDSGARLGTGLYFAHLDAESGRRTVRLVLVR